ncbi:MAG: hypothetical protein AB8G11_04505, partial [Saprospiraceae bacterium]
IVVATITSSFTYTPYSAIQDDRINSLSEQHCSSAFDNNVSSYTLKDNGYNVGHSVWISRKSGKVKAKYFADKQYGQVVNARYNTWKNGKKVVLMSSGTYANGYDAMSNKPVGITVDNGVIVNRSWKESMDALVIVYATGGIVVSNIEDGDLYLDALGKKVDVRKVRDRNEFLAWAVQENATVFQTHLTIFKNELKFESNHYQKNKETKRKMLILAKDSSGTLYHIIFYFKNEDYTLYQASKKTKSYLDSKDMNIIAAINLDTGAYDIISTGEGLKDCNGYYITGTKNGSRGTMTNILSYSYIE